MRKRKNVSAIVITLWIGLTGVQGAQAARDTDVAGFLHGEVGAGFGSVTERGRLFENAVEVGRFLEGESGPGFDFRFGVVPTVELFGNFPVVSKGYRSYKLVSQMKPCYYGDDPDMGQSGPNCNVGSTIYFNEIDHEYVANLVTEATPAYSWSGMDDMVIGARWAPFHEADLGSFDSLRKPANSAFPSLATWRMELGVVVNTGSNFYANGPGAGTTGVLLGTSFSKRIGVADPYLSARFYRYGTYQAVTTDGTGQSVTYEIDPSNETDILFGVELVPFEDERAGAKFAVDFASGAHVWSQSTLVSGTLLPSVIHTTYDADGNVEVQGTFGSLVSRESRMAYQFRLRLQYQIFTYLRVDALGQLQYVVPNRLESPYQVVQGHTVRAITGIQVTSTF